MSADILPRKSTPILAYHGVHPRAQACAGGISLSVSVKEFEWQMATLHEMGYEGVPLEELVDQEMSAFSSRRRVGISFDDGYQSVHEYAFPIMLQHKHRATVFAVTSCVGEEAGWESKLGDDERRLMSWQNLDELLRRGFTVGSHTDTHADLTALSPSAITEELTRSKKRIEEELQMPVSTIAYPYGRTNDVVASLAADSGYRAGFSLQYGSGNRFQLRRVLIQSCETELSFIHELSEWRDWRTHTCQQSEICRGWRKLGRMISAVVPGREDCVNKKATLS